jgi:hypothetical protein
VIAAVRPTSWDLPLFLHVAGAMTLVGVVATTLVLAFAGVRRPGEQGLARSAFLSLLAALPAWVVMRIGAEWTYSKEHFTGHNDPTWLGIGFAAADAGLIILLVGVGIAYAWSRQLRPWAPRALSGIGTLYLALLTLAWLAMTGKWG